MSFITVDPGLGGTGIVFWEESELQPRWSTVTTAHGSEGDWLERGHIISTSFYELVDRGRRDSLFSPLQKIYIEYPKLMSTSSGMASASGGSLFKLMFMVGVFAQQCWDMGVEFVPLPVNDWKGTMTKEVVSVRVSRVLGCAEDAFPNHTMDAVGMGLHLKGVLNGTGTRRIKNPRG